MHDKSDVSITMSKPRLTAPAANAALAQCMTHLMPALCAAASVSHDPNGAVQQAVAAVKDAVPDMHIHAFSPLEVWQGAATLKLLQQIVEAVRARPTPKADAT